MMTNTDRTSNHNKLLDILFLNILWILYCLPVITIGASTAAMYYTANKIARKDEYHVKSDFQKAFRQDMKEGTILWVAYAVLGVLFYYTGYQYFVTDPQTFILKKILIVIAVILYTLSFLYIFPLIARYSSTLSHSVINSLMVPFRFIDKTLIICVIVAVFIAVGYYVPWLIVVEVFPCAGFVCYFFSILLKSIFQTLEDLTAKEKETRERLMAELEAEQKNKELEQANKVGETGKTGH